MIHVIHILSFSGRYYPIFLNDKAESQISKKDGGSDILLNCKASRLASTMSVVVIRMRLVVKDTSMMSLMFVLAPCLPAVTGLPRVSHGVDTEGDAS